MILIRPLFVLAAPSTEGSFLYSPAQGKGEASRQKHGIIPLGGTCVCEERERERDIPKQSVRISTLALFKLRTMVRVFVFIACCTHTLSFLYSGVVCVESSRDDVNKWFSWVPYYFKGGMSMAVAWYKCESLARVEHLSYMLWLAWLKK